MPRRLSCWDVSKDPSQSKCLPSSVQNEFKALLTTVLFSNLLGAFLAATSGLLRLAGGGSPTRDGHRSCFDILGFCKSRREVTSKWPYERRVACTWLWTVLFFYSLTEHSWCDILGELVIKPKHIIIQLGQKLTKVGRRPIFTLYTELLYIPKSVNCSDPTIIPQVLWQLHVLSDHLRFEKVANTLRRIHSKFSSSFPSF